MYRGKVALVALLLALAIGAIALPSAARADGKWLDSQPLANWNQAGMSLPMAPPPGTPIDPRFAARERTPESSEDQALVANGWRLFTSYQAGWGIKVIPATHHIKLFKIFIHFKVVIIISTFLLSTTCCFAF